MDIRVSVIVPVFSATPYLKECIESIISQTLTETEIILINNVSDTEKELLDQFSELGVRVVHKRENNSENILNIGIHLAKGKYILFFGCNDWAEPQLLESLYDMALLYNADIVASSMTEDYSYNNSNFSLSNCVYKNERISSLLNKMVGPIVINDNSDRSLMPLNTVYNKLYLKSFILENAIRSQNINVDEDYCFNFSCFSHSTCIATCCQSYYHIRTCKKVFTESLASYFKCHNSLVLLVANEPRVYEIQQRLQNRLCIDATKVVIDLFCKNSFVKSHHIVMEYLSNPIIKNALHHLNTSQLSFRQKLIFILLRLSKSVLLYPYFFFIRPQRCKF